MTNDQINSKILNPKQLFKKYGIQPLKRLGQNFLIDKSVLNKIIEAADLSSNDIVLEIGPGLGVLTLELAKRVKRVITVEKDKKIYEILKEILKDYKNIELVNNDILKLVIGHWSLGFYKLVANLPYYITSPVIRKFLEIENKPESMVLMVQKEVAQRICARPTRLTGGHGGRAKPPKMNLLAVAVQFYAEPKIINYVSKKSFYPQPKVDSAIIQIIPKETPKIDSKKFFKIVKAGFSTKRKFLINNLSRELKIENCKLKIVFDQMGLGQKLRAENLSIDDWLKIYEII